MQHDFLKKVLGFILLMGDVCFQLEVIEQRAPHKEYRMMTSVAMPVFDKREITNQVCILVILVLEDMSSVILNESLFQ